MLYDASKEVVADFSRNYVKFDEDKLVPASAMFVHPSNSGLTITMKHLQVGSFMITRYNVTFSDLKNWVVNKIAITDKHYHMVRDLNKILEQGDYEILTKDEVRNIISAIMNSYEEFRQLRKKYNNSKYIHKFMTSLFYDHAKKIIDRGTEIRCIGEVNGVVPIETIERNSGDVFFSIKNAGYFYDLHEFIAGLGDMVYHILPKINRKVLFDEKGSVWIEIEDIYKLLKTDDGQFFSVFSPNPIFVKIVENIEDVQFLVMFKDGTYIRILKHYYLPANIHEKSDNDFEDEFIEYEEEDF